MIVNFLFFLVGRIEEISYIREKRSCRERYSDGIRREAEGRLEEVKEGCRDVARIPRGPRRVRLAPVLTSPGTETQLNFKMICAILSPSSSPLPPPPVFRDSPPLASIIHAFEFRN